MLACPRHDTPGSDKQARVAPSGFQQELDLHRQEQVAAETNKNSLHTEFPHSYHTNKDHTQRELHVRNDVIGRDCRQLPSQDVERLRQELDRYRQEQEQLRQTKARVLVMEERLRDLHWEDEVRES